MPRVLYTLLFVLSSIDSVSCSILFATTGENVTLQCQCSSICYEDLNRWVRINSDESLQMIDSKCKKSPCRFTNRRINNTWVVLTIAQVESGDSGRYYCGEHLRSYIEFTGKGTVLKVGDVWTHSSEVHMLMEWMGEGGNPELDRSKTQTSNSSQELMSEWMKETDENSKLDWSDFPDVEHTELRCVVTGLSAPWVNVFWKSSRESWVKAGQTWSLTDTESGYRVESRLQIGLIVKSDWGEMDKDEYDYSQDLQKKMDKMVEMDEELWCQVQVGVNLSVPSPKFSFLQQTHADPEWCNQVLYGEIALCALCTCLLTLLTLLTCLRRQYKGSEPAAAEASPTSDSCRDVTSNITYAQLNIKRQPRTDRRQRQKNRQEDRLVYKTAEGLVNPIPIVFSETGQNITIHSHINGKSNYLNDIAWYRVRPSGKLEHLASFNDNFESKLSRYSGEFPKDSDAYLNVSSATIGDSGLHFAAFLSDKNIKSGTSSVVAVIDPKGLPVMQVFRSRASGTVLCELKGGGPHWSDPQWEIEDGEERLKLQPKAETFVDEHGAFIRSSILSLEGGIRGLNCVCQHSTGVIIRTRVMQDSEDQCQVLLYLSPLAAVMLLVTVTASGLWAWRQWKTDPYKTGNGQQ
ncbi:hypothetical protein SKAU_G00224270 [Synaphobranchus kaupii]|uniref:Ig-like domain-containing protein n=1 Tax=Synaphobranchus kaupii TaxID=118154 RepID=A0A9Q1FBI4_SYNKA|nr:hypothetical protein SKAU_G00224270 [Synaphobranchus kaupii]